MKTIILKTRLPFLAFLGLTLTAHAQMQPTVVNAIQVLNSADIGVNHWAIEGMNYAAIGTYGGTIVRGNSINVGQFTVGGWSQLAPANGLYVGGDTLLNGNVGIGTATPAAKLDVAGTIDCQTLNFRAVGRLWSGAEMTLQSQAGTELYLNPFTGGDVVVGSFAGDRTLRVEGKVVTKTLELSSDKNVKAGFQAVNNRAVLERLANLPISTWHYTNAPAVRHIGPTAQDFMAAFRMGEDDKHISVVDGLGVALAAIQGLHAQVQEKDRQIASLKHQVASMKQELAGVKDIVSDRLAALEKAMSKNAVLQASFRPMADH